MANEVAVKNAAGEAAATVDVCKCARCGGTHEDLTFVIFARPVCVRDDAIFTEWAQCPQTGEPILLCRWELSGSSYISIA